MSEFVHIDFDTDEVTKAQLEGHQRTLAYWKRRRFPVVKPVPELPPPAPMPVLFVASDWRIDFDRSWIETVSPDQVRASVTPISATALEFHILASLNDAAGARALYDPTLNHAWTAFIGYHDRTIGFVNTWEFPQLIERYHGEDDGFMQWGIQLKADASKDAQASMAMCLYTVRGVGMRPYLTANTWAERAQEDDFPLLPVGVPFETRTVVHFHDDPTKGWMELQYAGRTLKVVGTNMAADGKVGVYANLYGTCDATMLMEKTRIAVLE